MRRTRLRNHQKRHYSDHTGEKRFPWRLIAILVCVAVLLVSGGMLVDYAVDYIGAKNAANELREIYYQETPVPTATATAAPTRIPQATAVPAITPIPQNTDLLPVVYYPGNTSARVRDRFSSLQRQNKDIIGWVRIDELLDEPVVQRDNTFYLTRDYRGYHNVNGAIFLDESCGLKTRPYTLTIYGHNMKTGAMFGGLRNYENINYYKNNPIISFDSAYEDGRYVIFSIATVSTRTKDRDFLDFSKLQSASIQGRQKGIDQLKNLSVYTTNVDVQPSDQLLLLVTCVEDENDRRVIAARRVRNGESEIKLRETVQKSRKK